MTLLLTTLALALDATPPPGEPWEQLATDFAAAVGRQLDDPVAELPEPTSLRFTVDGLLEERVLVSLEPGERGVEVRIVGRPHRARLIAHPTGWRVDGAGPLADALGALLEPGAVVDVRAWSSETGSWTEWRYGPAASEWLALVNRCSCPQTVSAAFRTASVVQADDGWPVFAVVVDEQRTDVLAGGAQRWGSTEASWHRTVWTRDGAPIAPPDLALSGTWAHSSRSDF